MTDRPRADVEIEGGSWVLFDAGRAPTGVGLGYFARRTRQGWADPAEDRRTLLDPDLDVGDLSEAGIRDLWASARGLTPTERRIEDAQGRLWLAQGVGPVWSERGTASEVVGVRLRCIGSVVPIVTAMGRGPDQTDDELRSLLASSDVAEAS